MAQTLNKKEPRTFEVIFFEFFNMWSPSVVPRSRYNMVSTYESYIHNYLGDLTLAEIDHFIVLQPIRVLEMQNKTRTSVRVRQIIARVFDYAFYLGECSHNPMNIVLKVTRKHTQKRYPFVDPIYLPDFFRQIQSKNLDKCHLIALFCIVFTASRSGEVFGMQWNELDFNSRIWRIPAARTKTRIDHEVFMCTQLVDLLEGWRAECPSEYYVFPSRYVCKNGEPITGASLRHAILRTKFARKQTLHGFRHIFSTYCYESNLWRDDAIELCIAHNPMSNNYKFSKRFYNHAKYKEEKARLMQWYGDVVEGWIFACDNEIIPI
ncbi:site-specific integrase [Acinetobacter sp. MD2(2019)]|uniref:tyrosine-type recombinase/integrase n=1 Tax=Acinetobacter sp. MD2(2019) TaxID=2605273 RepID=UPI002D1F537D|nr:site-specific integrase [Acinetobacter sp. MD2(2019)]MEB3754890.1 site-specific integrase [Acinetobacter sp. MD2(2019)]